MPTHLPRCRLISSFAVAFVLSTLFTAVAVRAEPPHQSTPRSRPSSESRRAKQRPAGKAPLSAEQEQAALQFVEKHYDPLMGVLVYLKENQPRQYARALHDLQRTRQRLEQIQQRSPRRYRLELEAWKLKSEIQLLSAQLVMSDSADIRRRLEEAVARQVDLRVELMKIDRRQAAQKLQRIDAALERLQSNRDQEVQRLTRQLVQKVERLRHAGTGKKRTRSTRDKRTNARRVKEKD